MGGSGVEGAKWDGWEAKEGESFKMSRRRGWGSFQPAFRKSFMSRLSVSSIPHSLA